MKPATFRRLLRELSPEVQDAFERAVDDLSGRVDWRRFVSAIEAGDVDRAMRVLDIDAGAFYEVREALRRVMRRGGVAEIASLVFPQTASFVVTFTLGNVRAERIAATLGSSMIQELTESARQLARERITTGLAEGTNPRTVARSIVGVKPPGAQTRMGGILGLTRSQASWADAADRELSSVPPEPKYFRRMRRDRRFDSAVRKAIDDKKPLDSAMRTRIIRFYRNRLLKMRGEAIARTEAISALNAGRYEALGQLIDSGTTTRDLIKLTWSDSRDLRVRDSHTAMNGQERRFGEPFQTPRGSFLRFPGDISLGAPADEIINCRCMMISEVDWLETYARGIG